MQPLIDGDILCYEIGYAAESGWQSPGLPSFDYVEELLLNRIGNICAMVEADAPPIVFLTGKKNFRTEIAKLRPYKERASHKPYHYYNIKAYLKGAYDCRCVEGLEADDLLAIEQTARPGETIICTRDKDLRAVPGWHYGWELGRQPQFGPQLVTDPGEIRLSSDRKSVKGEGVLFFYAQCLTGDGVDTVPGLPGFGPVKTFELLLGADSEEEIFKRVLSVYRDVYDDMAENALLEQGRLLWMTRKLNEDGSPILWEFPKVGTTDSGLTLNSIPS